MNKGFDAVVLHVARQGITVERTQRIDMEDAGRGVASVGDFNEGISDALRIHRRYLAPPLVVGFQMRQADVEKGRLEFVETAVQSQIFMMVFLRRTIVGQRSDTEGQILAVRGHNATVAEGTEVFAGIETEACGVGRTAGAVASVGGTMCLGGIFNHLPTISRAKAVNSPIGAMRP